MMTNIDTKCNNNEKQKDREEEKIKLFDTHDSRKQRQCVIKILKQIIKHKTNYNNKIYKIVTVQKVKKIKSN